MVTLLHTLLDQVILCLCWLNVFILAADSKKILDLTMLKIHKSRELF